jgi:uncharacterized membrane protein (Fun14 family)
MAHEKPSDEQTPNQRPPLALWKKVLLGVASLLVVGGAVAQTIAWTRAEPAAKAVERDAGSDALPPSAQGFVGNHDIDAANAQAGDAKPAEQTQNALTAYAPAMMKLGFGFFAGFCIGYAFRAFLKIGILVTGVLLALLIGLQYAGLISIDWSALDSRYHTLLGWLGGQFETFKHFANGVLPSAGTTLFGLTVGFKR